MERYNYKQAVLDDVRAYIKEEIDLSEWRGRRQELEEKLNDELWVNDSVTGNASGSYWFSSWKAEEALCHNLDLLSEALEELGGQYADLLDSPESCDVTIRCYWLSGAISEALDELEDELAEPEEEEEGDR